MLNVKWSINCKLWKPLGFLTKVLTFFVLLDSQFSEMNRSPCVLVLESFFCLFFLTHVCHVKCDSLSRAGRSSNCPVIVNGCSTPGNLPFVYKALFTPACTKHDVCYSCVSRCGCAASICRILGWYRFICYLQLYFFRFMYAVGRTAIFTASSIPVCPFLTEMKTISSFYFSYNWRKRFFRAENHGYIHASELSFHWWW